LALQGAALLCLLANVRQCGFDLAVSLLFLQSCFEVVQFVIQIVLFLGELLALLR